MIKLLPLGNNDPDLTHSVLFQSVLKTYAYLEEHGSIGLTKNGYLNRKFVHWAADNFEWEEFSRERMYRMNKVLNEMDYPPAGDIHDLLIHLRLARHYKGKFVLTKKGKELGANPSELFSTIVPAYLFECEHYYGPEPNWGIVLNIVNVEAESGVSVASLIKTFYGLEPQEGDSYRSEFRSECSNLSYGALRPLTWLGFLTEIKPDKSYQREEYQYFKTPLWRKCLRLDTDRQIKPRLVQ